MPEPLHIVIDYDPNTGKLEVAGAVENKVVMYGLLELVRDAIQETAQERRKSGGTNGPSKLFIPHMVLPLKAQ